jgi:hypothetical protein
MPRTDTIGQNNSRAMFRLNMPNLRIGPTGVTTIWGATAGRIGGASLANAHGGASFLTTAGPTNRFTNVRNGAGQPANGPYGDFGGQGSYSDGRWWDTSVNNTGTVGGTVPAADKKLKKVVLDEWFYIVYTKGYSRTSGGFYEFFDGVTGASLARYDGMTVWNLSPGGSIPDGSNQASIEFRVGPYLGYQFNTASYLEEAYLAIGTSRADVDVGYDPGGGPVPGNTAPTNLRAANASTVGSTILSLDPSPDADFDYFAIRRFVGTAAPPTGDASWTRLTVGGETRTVGGITQGGFFTTNGPIPDTTGAVAGQTVFYYATKVSKTGGVSGASVIASVLIGGVVADPPPTSIALIDDPLTDAASSNFTVMTGDAGFSSGVFVMPVGTASESGGTTAAAYDARLAALEFRGLNPGVRQDSNLASSWVTRIVFDWGGGNRINFRRRTVADATQTGLTGTASTDTFALSAHGFVVGDMVAFNGLTGGAGVSAGQIYYVIASGLTSGAFKVSATSGGSTIDFTTNVTAGRVTRIASDQYDLILREGGTDPSSAPPFVAAALVPGVTGLKVAFQDSVSAAMMVTTDSADSSTFSWQQIGVRQFSDPAIMTRPASYSIVTTRETGDVILSTPSLDRVAGSLQLQQDSSGASNGAITSAAVSFSGTQSIDFPIIRADLPISVVTVFKRASSTVDQYLWAQSKDATNLGRGVRVTTKATSSANPNMVRWSDVIGGAGVGYGTGPAPDYGLWQVHMEGMDASKNLTNRWSYWDPAAGLTHHDDDNYALSANGGSITNGSAKYTVGMGVPGGGGATGLRSVLVAQIVYDHVLTAAEYRSIFSATGIPLRARAEAISGCLECFEFRTATTSYTGHKNSTASTVVNGTLAAFAALTGVTGVTSTDTFTKTAHGLSAGAPVAFSGFTGGSGLVAGQTYYVRTAGLTANAFTVSAAPGGAAVDLGSDVSGATVSEVPWDTGTAPGTQPGQGTAPPQPTVAPSLSGTPDVVGTTATVTLTSPGAPAGLTQVYYASDDGVAWTRLASNVATGIPVDDDWRYAYRYRDSTGLEGDFSPPLIYTVPGAVVAGPVPLTRLEGVTQDGYSVRLSAPLTEFTDEGGTKVAVWVLAPGEAAGADGTEDYQLPYEASGGRARFVVPVPDLNVDYRFVVKEVRDD